MKNTHFPYGCFLPSRLKVSIETFLSGTADDGQYDVTIVVGTTITELKQLVRMQGMRIREANSD